MALHAGPRMIATIVRPAAHALVAAGVAVATYQYRYLTYSGFANDHFVHLSAARQMLEGDWPVRDFVERGMPLMNAVSALAQYAMGEGLLSELRLVAALFAVAAVLTYAVAAALSGSMLIGLAAAAATVVVHPVAYSYPKLLVYAAGAAAAWIYVQRPTQVRAAVLAAVVAVAFLFRHDHGVLLGAAALLLIVARRGLTRAAAADAGVWALAGLVCVAPYLAVVQIHQGLGAYAAQGVAFSQRESARAEWYAPPSFSIDRTASLFRTIEGGPIVNVRWADSVTEAVRVERERTHGMLRREAVGPQTWQYELRRWGRGALRALVADPAVADTHNIDRESFRIVENAPPFLRGLFVGWPVPTPALRLRSNAVAAMFYLTWMVPVFVAGTLAVRWRTIAPGVRATAAMLVALQLLMNVTMLREPLDARVRDVILPLVLAAAVIAGAYRTESGALARRFLTRSLAALPVLIVLAVAAALGPLPEHVVDARLLEPRARAAEIREELQPPAHRTGRISPEYQRLVAYVTRCVPAGRRLFVMTFAPELFFYTDRGFAGGHVALTAGYYTAPADAAAMLERLGREQVPLVVLDSETEREVSVLYAPVVDWIEQRYVRVGELPLSGDRRLILLAASHGQEAAIPASCSLSASQVS